MEMLSIACVALAVMTLLAVAGAWVYRKEWRRTKKLFDIGLQLNATIKRKDLLQVIMETASRTMRAEGSSIILQDETTGELYFEVATGGNDEQIKEIRLKPGEGVAGWVAKTGESVLITDAQKDERWSNRVSAKVKVPTRSLLCVPVMSNGKTLGVLQVINKKGGKPFNKRDLTLLEMIASPTAVALENMFLYEALLDSMQSLRETTVIKEKMESELKIARGIQYSFLPGHDLYMRKTSLHASLVPAREVGGDFYHFIELDERRLLLCLGDVSDKGMPSALFMSAIMIWIQAKASAASSPARILEEINREISQEYSTMFATLFMAILDTETGHLRYCDAGHCPPFVLGKGQVRMLETAKHLPIGIFADEQYEERDIHLQQGESLVLYTDGITEAENAEGEWFTTAKLNQVLAEHADAQPSEVIEVLRNQVFAFADGHPQSDDIAVLVAKYGEMSGL